MSVTIECKSGNLSYDLRTWGFESLRMKVASLSSEEWGKHYSKLMKPPFCHKELFYESFNRVTEDLIKKRKVSSSVVNFCLQSDCGGKATYRQCREIYKHIKDYDDDVSYGFAGQQGNFTFNDFKALLEHCIENKCGFEWY